VKNPLNTAKLYCVHMYKWYTDISTLYAWFLYTASVCCILQNMEHSGYCGQKYKVCLSLQFLQPFRSFKLSFKACSCIKSKCGCVFCLHIVTVSDFPVTDQQADSEIPRHGLFSVFSKLQKHSALTSITNVKLMVLFHCCGQIFKSSSKRSKQLTS
jgi:glycogen synthase